MSAGMLEWQDAMSKGGLSRAEYAAKLRDFVSRERDTAAIVQAALQHGETEKAWQMVRNVKKCAVELGARELAQAAFSLEMAIRAGADTIISLKHFDAVAMDTMLAMSGFLAT